LGESFVVLGFVRGWRGRVLRLELVEAVLTRMYVGQKVIVVIEEI
jgi:hypothetical protein